MHTARSLAERTAYLEAMRDRLVHGRLTPWDHRVLVEMAVLVAAGDVASARTLIHHVQSIEGQRTAWALLGQGTMTKAAQELLDLVGKDPHGHRTPRQIQKLAKAGRFDPDDAVKASYERGVRYAPFVDAAVQGIFRILRTGNTVVLHGRDMDGIFEVLKRTPEWPRIWRKVVYVVTSSPLLRAVSTPPENRSTSDRAYVRYLESVLPKSEPAVHVDTCCGGTTPQFLKSYGWNVVGFEMLDTYRETASCRMPETKPYGDFGYGLESSPHLLASVEVDLRWRQGGNVMGVRLSGRGPQYARNNRSFWAFVYGITDTLHLPREIPKGHQYGRRARDSVSCTSSSRSQRVEW